MERNRPRVHADFLSVDPSRRWRAGLPALWASLSRQLRDGIDQSPWYTTPNGCLVSLRADNGRRVLRIARRIDVLDSGRTGFERICSIFVRAFACEHWPREDADPPQVFATIYREPVELFACLRCGKSLDENARLFGEQQVCSACATGAA